MADEPHTLHLGEFRQGDGDLALRLITRGICQENGVVNLYAASFLSEGLCEEFQADVTKELPNIRKRSERALAEAQSVAYGRMVEEFSHTLSLESDLDFYGSPPF